MRSGAAAAKAEVQVEQPILPAAPQHLSLDRRPSRLPPTPPSHSLSGRREEGALLPPELSAPLSATQPQKGSPFARLQHGGRYTSGHRVRAEFPRPSRRSGPCCRQAAPTHLGKARASLPTEASRLHRLEPPGDSSRQPEQTFILEEADSPRAVIIFFFFFVFAFKKFSPRVLSLEGILSPKRMSFPFFEILHDDRSC